MKILPFISSISFTNTASCWICGDGLFFFYFIRKIPLSWHSARSQCSSTLPKVFSQQCCFVWYRSTTKRITVSKVLWRIFSAWNVLMWPLFIQHPVSLYSKSPKHSVQSLWLTSSSGSYLENENMFEQYACINIYAYPNTTAYGFLLAIVRNTKAYLDYVKYKDI